MQNSGRFKWKKGENTYIGGTIIKHLRKPFKMRNQSIKEEENWHLSSSIRQNALDSNIWVNKKQ